MIYQRRTLGLTLHQTYNVEAVAQLGSVVQPAARIPAVCTLQVTNSTVAGNLTPQYLLATRLC